MKSPNLASRNHFILASWEAGAGKALGRVCAAAAEARAIVIVKIRLFGPDMGDAPGEIPLERKSGAGSNRAAVENSFTTMNRQFGPTLWNYCDMSMPRFYSLLT